MSLHVVNTFLFSIGIKGNFCILGVPNLLVGTFIMLKMKGVCLVAEPDKVLVGDLNEWVAIPLSPGQTRQKTNKD